MKIKLTKRKKIILGVAAGVVVASGATALIVHNAKKRESYCDNMKDALAAQAEYIFELENFIIDRIGEEQFEELVSCPVLPRIIIG